MPAFTYHCELVQGGQRIEFPTGAEVVEETDTEEGLRVWYRVPDPAGTADGETPEGEDSSDD